LAGLDRAQRRRGRDPRFLRRPCGLLGIIIAAYQSYSGGVPEQVVQPYRLTGTVLLGTFALGLITVAVSLLWLINGGPLGLYGWTIGLFALQLVAVFGSAAWATRMVLFQ
jgi:hypothetical protein